MTVGERVQLWLEGDQDENNRQEIQKLIAEQSPLLEVLFGEDLSFGTAGLRAAMAPFGWSRMNRQTVQLASQGVAGYLQAAGKQSVVIGHDHRHNSREFSLIAARVFHQAGLRVYRYEVSTPTPLVPFGVCHLGADFGVMITASHNPACDNGYKVYGGNGCQIMSPVDKEIAAQIHAQQHRLWPLKGQENAKGWECPLEAIWGAYVGKMQGLSQALLSASPRWIPPIVYTPLHGLGGPWIERLLHRLNLPQPIPVDAQYLPDPDFPTLRFPNPEEGKGALAMAMEKAAQCHAKWIFANDPDVDRFNVAELQADGEWRIFNGNEIACLYAQLLWKHRASLGKSTDKFAMVSSGVSSNALRQMAQQEGFVYEATLTGFKYIANAAQRLEREAGCKVLLAYEEAIGFMIDTIVWDKDGLGALLAMYALILELGPEGSLVSCLEQFELRYGCFLQHNGYYFCHTTPRAIFQSIRERLGQPPLPLLKIEDQGNTQITLHISDTQWLTLRASGTEPKVKFYSETYCRDPTRKEAMQKEHTELIKQLLAWLLPTSQLELAPSN